MPWYTQREKRRTAFNIRSFVKDVQAAATADVLNSVDVASTNPIPVFYQSGYLTIKGYVLPFEMDGQQIIRIGLNFDRQTRNLERWVVG